MHSLSACWRLLAFALLALSPVRSSGLTLYATEFEEFTAGTDKWVGTNGWLGTSTGVGVHGIDQDILPGLGKTAFLGYARPRSTFVTVFRPVLYDPVSNGTPVIEFETLMGIQDSTNGHRDSFFFTFYNRQGALLASLRFDNSDLSYGVWRLDGTNQSDTGIDFIRSELHLVLASINFSNNLWAAYLDGIPLFTGAQFNANSRALNLGYVAAEWQLTSPLTNNYGDNWMLVADWAVRAFPPADQPYPVQAVTQSTNGWPTLSWTGTRGFDYTVQYSDDLETWQSGLADSSFSNVLAITPLSFMDTAAVSQRAYRLHRSFAP